MKIYAKIVYDIESGETIYKESFNYQGPVALCGGGGNGGDTETTIRYAGYIESKHQAFLNEVQTKRIATVDDSPFTGYTDIIIDDAFFGAGYLISSFPSLYDMYGKFMAGLDIDVLYSQLFEDTVNAPEVSNLVSAEAALMDDDIDTNIIPRLIVGQRDINSVMASSFIVGKAVIEDARVKSLSRFSAELKYRLIPIALERWKIHLDWNKLVVGIYAEIMKFYFSAKVDVNDANYTKAAQDKLWPFTVLEFERAALGALQGAMNTATDVAGSSTAAKVLSGALTGAAMGATVGSAIAPATAAVPATATTPATAATAGGAGYGAAAGAALGIAAALTY